MSVIDSSVAIKIVIEEEHSAEARALYRTTIRDLEVLLAPPLLLAEVTNILHKRVRRSEQPMTLAEATRVLDDFMTLEVAMSSPDRLYHTALELADRYRLPAAYDAQYLALALLDDSEFWTADRRLLNHISGRLPFVKWIGSYQGT